MPGIGVLININAARSHNLHVLRDRLTSGGGNSLFLEETSSVDEVEGVARRFMLRDIDVLAIWGGDGTNHHALTSFMRVYGNQPLPKVAFLRAGTHNACARSIGLSGSPLSILERVVNRYRSGRSLPMVKRGVMRIDQGNGVEYGFTLATGYLHSFFETMHRTAWNTPGKIATLLVSMFGAFFLGSRLIDEMFRCQPARICIGDEWLDWPDSNGIAAASMEQVGLGLRPFSRVEESRGCFHALAFRITPARFVRKAWSLARGQLGDHSEHVDRVTDRLVLEAQTPIPYACDGDLFCAGTRLEITSGPRLQLVRV